MARGSVQPQVGARSAAVIRAAKAHRSVVRRLAEASVAVTGAVLKSYVVLQLVQVM
jgi:hypothetical protein